MYEKALGYKKWCFQQYQAKRGPFWLLISWVCVALGLVKSRSWWWYSRCVQSVDSQSHLMLASDWPTWGPLPGLTPVLSAALWRRPVTLNVGAGRQGSQMSLNANRSLELPYPRVNKGQRALECTVQIRCSNWPALLQAVQRRPVFLLYLYQLDSAPPARFMLTRIRIPVLAQ